VGRALSEYAGLPLWHETAGGSWAPRPPLDGDVEADVAIVGAGYTGLWTAYHLAEADPSLRMVVLESEVAGFGASGRKGGWCSALFPASLGSLARLGGREAALAQHAAMRGTVGEVVRVAAAEGIDAQVAKGGTLTLARTGPQWDRARREVTPRARHVVRATEGFTALLPGSSRAVAPVYSLMIATEPLPEAMWEQIGLRERETFTDHRHLVIYGQRTADGCSTCSLSCAARRWRTPGAGRSASRATGARRSAWTPRPDSRGRAGTSATGSAPPTSPAAR
jgi:glycine/D-amino acid oxidase-like deaminating enzyme